MTASTLILWRHGRTPYNRAGRLQGQLDIDLDAVGRAQAAAAATWLAKREPAAIVASDLRRAQDTAGALAELTGLAVPVDAELREQDYGRGEGLTRDQIRDRWPDELAAWDSGDADVAAFGGESRAAAGRRVAQALRRHVESTDGTLVVTGHGASLRCAVADLLGDVADWYRLGGFDNAHWATLELRRRGWALRDYNVGAAPLD